MSEAELLVSVLAPLWNEERHIDQMIDSLAQQSYPNWELVVVDDGSTDKTVDIVMSRAAVDSRIRFAHHGQKVGKVQAFNMAFAASMGQIICHLGGDDMARRDAMGSRTEALRRYIHIPAVAYFHLSMFSETPARGTVLPRGSAGSRSGPSTTLTRPLARRIFPIPDHLVSEDLWIGEASYGLAEKIVHSPEVVVDYRVHPGNSNPRSKTFEEMSRGIHERMKFAPALLAEERFELAESVRLDLERRWAAEQLRYEGRILSLLRSDLRLIDKLALTGMSHPLLWRIRQKAFRALSGWRGR